MSSEQEPESEKSELEAAEHTAAEDAIQADAEPGVGIPTGPVDSAAPNEESAATGPDTPAIGPPEKELEAAGGGSGPPRAKLERLQKILAQAGVASRRRAEELIAAGRVEVNGAVVTELGSKADPARDHIRVDGKLLHGAERLRYFMLNKPRGFVTTVSDPEGRPTVMQFFSKMRERLFPVGRLDFQSEGLLLVTNDGDLAHRLTRAASAIEKTYLVKVSGRPTEAELDVLRGGVDIDRTRPGSDRVRTAPARIRQVRKGENPWFEVTLIEGRNRELRKMFEEIGHHVEKIRRVGYGPLVLDLEPGKLRELAREEVAALRRAAEGKPGPPGATRRERSEPAATAPRSDRAGKAHMQPGSRRQPAVARRPDRSRHEPRREDRRGKSESSWTRSGRKQNAGEDRSFRPSRRAPFRGGEFRPARRPLPAKPQAGEENPRPNRNPGRAPTRFRSEFDRRERGGFERTQGKRPERGDRPRFDRTHEERFERPASPGRGSSGKSDRKAGKRFEGPQRERPPREGAERFRPTGRPRRESSRFNAPQAPRSSARPGQKPGIKPFRGHGRKPGRRP
jgi:23S rRNA pseudouridine2605 synthase